MNIKNIEVKADLDGSSFNFIIQCEATLEITKDVINDILCKNKIIPKHKINIIFAQREISVSDCIISRLPKFRTDKIKNYHEHYGMYLRNLLKVPLNFNT